MDRTAIETPDAPAAIGPYSQAIKAGNLVFTAGQIALIPGTKDIDGDDVAAQTERVFRNLEAVLTAAGSGLDRIVKTTVYLRDMADFSAMNEVYGRFLSGSAPARSTVAARQLPMDVLVEIDAVALAG